MAYQGFSPKLELAKLIAKAKASGTAPLSQVEKDRQKLVNQARLDKRRAENLAQRALIESKRT
jgi:hypothetical protein